MSIRDIVLTALFAALIAAMGFMPAIPLSFIPVPVTLQTLGVMLAGSVLGTKRGVAAVLVIYILVAAGLPLLAVARGGLSQFVMPTSGYLYGWVPGAFFIGLGYQYLRNKQHPLMEIFVLILGGIVIIHLCGILWLTLGGYMHFQAAVLADLIFVPGDLVKVALAFIITRSLHRALPGKL